MTRVGHVRLDERRLEQVRLEVAHHLSRADRGEIRRPLSRPFALSAFQNANSTAAPTSTAAATASIMSDA
jgi:hypothetical protein